MEPIRYDVRLTRRAEHHLESIHRYIARDSVVHADRLLLTIASELSRLSRFPESGRVGRIRSTRELVITGTRYLAVYRIRQQNIDVVGIYHGAQRLP